MGSYGIGPARIVAAAVEQRADEKGIGWPPAIAPWQVHIVRARQGRRRGGRRRGRRLRGPARAAGIETVLDDRPNAGTGEKLTDAELIGCPLRLTIGKRGLADGVAEAQVRAGGEEERIPLDEVAGASGRSSRRCVDARGVPEGSAAPRHPAAGSSASTAPGPSRRRPAPASRCGRSRSRT